MTKRIVVVAAAVAVMSGCSPEMAHLRVIRANYNVSRGEYQTAIVDYLRTAGERRFEPWVAYNLGNVYHFLGESASALERWDTAAGAGEDDLLFGASFNRGVLLFEQGRFDDALAAFRAALIVDPSSLAAKVNIELALERIEAESTLDQSASSSAEDLSDEDSQEGAIRILDYVRRREEQRWRARTESAPPAGERDW